MEEIVKYFVELIKDKSKEPPIIFPEFGLADEADLILRNESVPSASMIKKNHNKELSWHKWEDEQTPKLVFNEPEKRREIYYIDFLALLSDREIEKLVAPTPFEDQTLAISFIRLEQYCALDNDFFGLSSTRSPLLLPPFWEARKMVRAKIELRQSLESEAREIDLNAWAESLDFSFLNLVPGCLVLNREVVEQQITCKYLGGRSPQTPWRIAFPNMCSSAQLIYLELIPKEGNPFLITSADLTEDNKYYSPQEINSYTLVKKKSGDFLKDSLGASCKSSEYRDILNWVAQKRRNWDFTPSPAWMIGGQITAPASRGDIDHLLRMHPLCTNDDFKVEVAKFVPVQDQDRSQKIFDYWSTNKPFLDYSPRRMHSILTDRCFFGEIEFKFKGDLPDNFEIFKENIEDYFCSCLNLFMGLTYCLLSSSRISRVG